MHTVLTLPESPRRQTTRLTISLYELIEALQDTAGPDGDILVVATVRHLLESGRITMPRYAGMSHCN